STACSVETTGLGWDDTIPIPDKIDVNPAPFSHANISWTVCYDDSCPTHYQDKMGANWFPQFRPMLDSKGDGYSCEGAKATAAEECSVSIAKASNSYRSRRSKRELVRRLSIKQQVDNEVKHL